VTWAQRCCLKHSTGLIILGFLGNASCWSDWGRWLSRAPSCGSVKVFVKWRPDLTHLSSGIGAAGGIAGFDWHRFLWYFVWLIATCWCSFNRCAVTSSLTAFKSFQDSIFCCLSTLGSSSQIRLLKRQPMLYPSSWLIFHLSYWALSGFGDYSSNFLVKKMIFVFLSFLPCPLNVSLSYPLHL